MKNNITAVEQVWKVWEKGWLDQVQIPSRYEMPGHLARLAALFSPGQFYFYIVDMYNLRIQHISPSVKELIGIIPEESDMKKLLAVVVPEVLPQIATKEAMGVDFLNRFLPEEDRLHYKYVYTYPYVNHRGERRDMMIQVSVLSLSNTGKAQQILGIHTDITHLNVKHNDTVSFISLNGKENYMHVPMGEGIFDPRHTDREQETIAQKLTEREKDIVGLLAKGLGDAQIANIYDISVYTVRTHRRNMLKKTGCKNSIELVTECLMCGLI